VRQNKSGFRSIERAATDGTGLLPVETAKSVSFALANMAAERLGAQSDPRIFQVSLRFESRNQRTGVSLVSAQILIVTLTSLKPT
jgi:hypothetical protein